MTTKETIKSNHIQNIVTESIPPFGNGEIITTGVCNTKMGILSDSEKIELLSEDVQEILGQPPKWIVRWGVTVFMVVLFLVLSGSFVFKYPDVISGAITIVSENPPVEIMAQSTGKIEQIFVNNLEVTKPGSYLAVLENTANYKHILELKENVKLISEKFALNDFSNFVALPTNYYLGTIQSSFSSFQRQYNEYKKYLTINIIGQKNIALHKQISDFKTYLNRLDMQSWNLLETLKLQKKQFERDSVLLATKVITPADYEKSLQAYIQAKNNYQGGLASIANSNMQINQLQFQLVDLQGQLLDQTGTIVNTLKEALDNLESSILIWEKAYVLISPIEGKITFVNFWSANQYVVSGIKVFTIVPSKPQKVLGKLKFPVAGSGKVKKGQKVLIRIDNFPYTEFGMLEGNITDLSLIPEITQQGAFYSAEVVFEQGLITNYKKVLPFNQEMQGTAEIITQKLSLFERLIQPIKSAIHQSF